MKLTLVHMTPRVILPELQDMISDTFLRNYMFLSVEENVSDCISTVFFSSLLHKGPEQSSPVCHGEE